MFIASIDDIYTFRTDLGLQRVQMWCAVVIVTANSGGQITE